MWFSLCPTLMASLRRTRGRRNNYISQNYMNRYYEGHDIDKISELPRDLLSDILNRLTMKDIARMAVLSKKWNKIWCSHPILVLDKGFREGLNYHFDFKDIVNRILFRHKGPLIKIVLDISSLDSYDWDLYNWMQCVSDKGVKELTIDSFESTYTLPSFLLNSGLSHLSITNCAFKMPLAATSFQNLVRLYLAEINFDSISAYTVVEAPLLVTMVLVCCEGLPYLNISAPRLLFLQIINSYFMDFSFLKAYTKLKVLNIASCDRIESHASSEKLIESHASSEKLTLREIICSFPNLTSFFFNDHFFKFTVPEVFPKRLGTRLENLLNLDLGLSFANEAQISGVIFLLNNSPQLQSFVIEHSRSNHDEEISMIRVQKYLTAPDCIEEYLMAVRKIKLEGFVNAVNERLFMKLMLARCPSLLKVVVTTAESIDQCEIFSFIAEVMKFPRASLNVNIELK